MDPSRNEKVNEVYSYWFDGDQQVNYRTKWFPEGNTDIQSKADNEVNDLFGPLLNDALAGNLDSWIENVKSCVALIVILDQLSRHVFRLQLQPPNSPLRIEADAKALRIAKQFHSDNDNLLNLSMAEYVFSLMPLRHTATVDHLTFILSNLKEKEAVEAKSMELLNKFRKQTVRRLQHLQDREKLEATDDILERSAFQADESDIFANKLLKTTESFLLRQIKASDQSAEGVTLFISLSGGVDSMVLSKILVLLKAQHNSSANNTNKSQLRIDKVVGIHIDYANRPESGRECAYVQQWCEAIGVEFRARVINEVTRGITSRDEYEKVAREIRYAFYVECLRENGVQAGTAPNTADAPSQRVGVMFGHHIGDVQENVISNVMRGVSPLDLSGMTESSVSNGVVVWRPLLTHSKDEIYDFAHKYGVPYFKDSTPSWSTRGKLRNQLVPLLVDMYGEGCLRNLSALAAESDQVRDLVTDNIYAPFMNSVERFPCGLKVNILPFRYQPLCFWREVLKTLMHSMSMCMVRDKAVLNFVARIQKTTPGTPVLSGWLELRKGFHTMLTESGSLVILRDGVLYKDLPSVSPVTANQLTQRQAKRGAPKREVVETTPAAPASVSAAVAVVNQFSLRVNYNEHNLSESTTEGSDDVLHALALSFSQQSLDELNKVQFDQEATSDASATSTATSPKVLRIGSWEVTLEVVPSPYSKTVNPIDTTEIADISAVPHISSSAPPTSLRNLKKYNKKLTSDKDKLLSVLEEVLPGRFSYHILLSHRSSSSENGAFIDLSLFSNSHLVNTAGTFDVSACPLVALSADLHKMEGRLREGLPLLVPSPAAMSANSCNEVTTADSIHKLSACSQSLKLTYNYIGTCKHNAGSH